MRYITQRAALDALVALTGTPCAHHLRLVRYLNGHVLELSRRNSTLKENIQLAERPAFSFREPEERPNETAHARAKLLRLAWCNCQSPAELTQKKPALLPQFQAVAFSMYVLRTPARRNEALCALRAILTVLALRRVDDTSPTMTHAVDCSCQQTAKTNMLTATEKSYTAVQTQRSPAIPQEAAGCVLTAKVRRPTPRMLSWFSDGRGQRCAYQRLLIARPHRNMVRRPMYLKCQLFKCWVEEITHGKGKPGTDGADDRQTT